MPKNDRVFNVQFHATNSSVFVMKNGTLNIKTFFCCLQQPITSMRFLVEIHNKAKMKLTTSQFAHFKIKNSIQRHNTADILGLVIQDHFTFMVHLCYSLSIEPVRPIRGMTFKHLFPYQLGL